LQQLGLLSSYALDPSPEELALDALVATQAVDLAWAMVRWVLEVHMQFSHNLPGKFVGLVHPDQSVVDATLKWCQRVHQALLHAQRVALHDQILASFLKDLRWTESTFVMEILTEMSEFGFEVVTPHIKGQVVGMMRRLPCTKLVEDLFNHLSGITDHHKAEKMSAKSQVHHASTSSLLEESDRTQVRITRAAKQLAPNSLPGKAFKCWGGTCSLGPEFMLDLGGPGWRSASPAAMQLVPFATHLLSQMGQDFVQVQKCWQSILLSPGVAIQQRRSPTDKSIVFSGLCIQVNKFGAVLWRLAKVRGSDPPLFTIDVDTRHDTCWRLVQIVDITQYTVCPMRAVSPCQARQLAKGKVEDSATPCGIVLQMDQARSQPLLKFAASRCFLGMTLPHLNKLMTALHMPFDRSNPRPKKEPAILRALVEHILPQATPEEVNAILALRAGAKDVEAPPSELFNEGNLDLTSHLFDDEDQKDAKKTVQKAKASATAMSKAARGSFGASSSQGSRPRAAEGVSKAEAQAASSSTVGSAAKRKKVPNPYPGTDYSSAEARQWCPDAKQCSLGKDDVRHHRWQCHYGKCNASKAWGPNTGYTDYQAMVYCLRYLWAQHREATGEACPFVF